MQRREGAQSGIRQAKHDASDAVLEKFGAEIDE
jgi:hypothetical protein